MDRPGIIPFGLKGFPLSVGTKAYDANFDSNNVSILLGSGTGTFGTATNFSVGAFPFSPAVGDFNGDGKPDLAVANRDSNNVSILLNR